MILAACLARVTRLSLPALGTGRAGPEEVKEVNGIAREVGRTVRAAMQSTPKTVRLCALIIVVMAMWFLLMVHQGV